MLLYFRKNNEYVQVSISSTSVIELTNAKPINIKSTSRTIHQSMCG